MASGDRIELLTAGTFESAMSTVARESSVQSCYAKIDNVDADVAALVPTMNNINNVTSADYQLNQTIHNVLADLYNNRIGVTNNGGGTAAAGTVMGKLNTLINNIGTKTNSRPPSLDVAAFKKFNVGIGQYDGNQTILNIAGSGTLYSVLAYVPNQVTIVVDGHIIFNVVAGSYYMGIVASDIAEISDNTLYCKCPYTGSIARIDTGVFSNGAYSPASSAENAQNKIFISPAPIKFSSSLTVTASKSPSFNGAQNFWYSYVLD